MKILHVIPSYVPAYRYGGPVTTTHALCKGLVKEGLDITVFTTDMDREKKLDVPLNKMVNIDGVKVFYYPVTRMKFYYYSKELAKAIKKHVQDFDLVHIHSVYLYPTFSAAYWCRRRNIPYILNPFGALSHHSIRLKGYFRKKLYIELIEKHNINNAKAIHAASLYEKDMMHSLGFKKPITVIPRSIELEEYNLEQRSDWLETNYPQLRNKKIILFLGRIHPKKGLDLLISAFEKIIKENKNVNLVIAGPDEDKYKSKVKKMVERKGMGEKVVFTGMVLDEKKVSIFHSSDIFALPSYGENFGVTVIEAMGSGLPVVITNCVGCHGDVKKYKAGIITSCNADQIAIAMTNLLNNENLRKEMGRRGKALAKEKFSLDKVANEMHKVYGNIRKVTADTEASLIAFKQ